MTNCTPVEKSKPSGRTLKAFSIKSTLVVVPSAVCSLAGWSLSFYSLKFTSPSSYAILRGTVIIFTAINSNLFLNNHMSWKQWGSFVIIFAGFLIVGMADIHDPANFTAIEKNTTHISMAEGYNCSFFNKARDSNFLSNEIIGDVLVVAAQIFLSLQFVYEEKVLALYEIEPLQVVGWEGFYGLMAISMVLVPLNVIDTGSCLWSNSPTFPWTVDDAMDGFIQIMNNRMLLASLCLSVVLEAL